MNLYTSLFNYVYEGSVLDSALFSDISVLQSCLPNLMIDRLRSQGPEGILACKCLSQKDIEWSLNPEIFAALFALNRGDCSKLERVFFINLLLVHMGQKEPCSLSNFAPTIRLLGNSKRNNALNAIGKFNTRIAYSQPFLKNLEILFEEPRLYDDLGLDKFFVRNWGQQERLCAKLRLIEAICIMEKFSSDIYSDFMNFIKLIVVFDGSKSVSRQSFSCRTSYLGAIFISVSDRSIMEIVEDLIHEYYHQRIWAWWRIAPAYTLPDLPTIISPMTGNERSLSVMFHASLVYKTAIELLNWARDRYEKDFLKTDAERLKLLTKSLPKLTNEIVKILEYSPRKFSKNIEFLQMKVASSIKI